MITVVTTQEELDAAIEDGAEGIVIDSPPSVRLQLRGSGLVAAVGSSRVDACGSTTVDAWDSSHVTVWDTAHVRLRSPAATATVGGRFEPPVRL